MRNNVYTVSQVNKYIKDMFMQDMLLRRVTVEGEVSNCKYHTSGHIYFTIKDGGAALSCVMFAGKRAGLKCAMRDGMLVQVSGSISVYEKSGSYQLYAEMVVQGGIGDLYARYEALKKELYERGMFDEVYKQEIPRFIRTLGVVTAPTGAAVRDIIDISTRRNPYIQIILYPAIVQGEEAPASIVRGIEALTAHGVDTIIVGRGGGSIEDLWAFNEEIVAQAIFDCPIPIISAVGHETDTTIADYVADLRAPTPSAAAELAVFEYGRFVEQLQGYQHLLVTRMEQRIALTKGRLHMYEKQLSLLSPQARVRDYRMHYGQLYERLQMLMENRLTGVRHRLERDAAMLDGVSPLKRLQGGYSYVADAEGQNIKSITQVRNGDVVHVHVTDGVVHARVYGMDAEERYGTEEESDD